MNWLDKIIAAVAPAWAYRRQQYREALRAAEESAVETRRASQDSGWVPWDRSPLNPEVARAAATQDAAWPPRRPWTW